MSPCSWAGRLYIYAVSENASIVCTKATSANTKYIRPVISIDKCAKVTGIGTPTDPYVIDESASTCD